MHKDTRNAFDAHNALSERATQRTPATWATPAPQRRKDQRATSSLRALFKSRG